jgi:hypothetical protein
MVKLRSDDLTATRLFLLSNVDPLFAIEITDRAFQHPDVVANANALLFGTHVDGALRSLLRRLVAGALLARCGSYAPAHRFAETGQAWPHATHLGEFVTLAFAQHYGLPTPALDVTTDFGVALWFALHTLMGSGGNTSVRPASGGEGVVYVIAGGRGEYFGEDLPDLTALRPRRQHGGFLASPDYASGSAGVA